MTNEVNPTIVIHMSDPEDSKPVWLTTGGVQEMLPEVTVRAVQKWLLEGRFEGALKTPGGKWRVPRSSVEKFLKEMEYVPDSG